MKIKILVTGGTVDDLDYDSQEKAPKDHQSLVPGLLKQSRVSTDYDIEVLMQKDSRFVTDEDRGLLVQKCKETEEDKILITHGTLTMPITAKYLGSRNLNKTVVLFGAAIPANKENSDALFNLGTAISAVQLLQPGVYISMNGKIFPWDNVKKNLETGKFENES